MMVLGAIVSCSSVVDPAREPTLAKADGRAGWPSTWRTALSAAPNTWAATVRGAAGNASTCFRPIPVRRARSRARVTQARPVRTARSPQTIPATAAAGTGRVLRRLAFTSGVRDGQRCRPECHRAAASARAGQAQRGKRNAPELSRSCGVCIVWPSLVLTFILARRHSSTKSSVDVDHNNNNIGASPGVTLSNHRGAASVGSETASAWDVPRHRAAAPCRTRLRPGPAASPAVPAPARRGCTCRPPLQP